MKTPWLLFFFLFIPILSIQASPPLRTTIDLNGDWDFDQTKEAFPPETFTRKIPVPGLLHLARPKIQQFDVLYTKQYTPQYNWYRRMVHVPGEWKDTHAVLSILKSKYVTQVYINGMDVGTSMACYTPIEFPVTRALKFGEENEILIRVGERTWLPSAAAGSTDKEKIAYLAGIWDNVSLSFTGPFRIHRVLMLPSIQNNKVTAKLKIRNFYPSQVQYGDKMLDVCNIEVTVFEKNSSRQASPTCRTEIQSKRDAYTEVTLAIPMDQPHLWTPDDPFLYRAEVKLFQGKQVSDTLQVNFGMREFGRQGKYFTLNGKKILLRGTNITLHRFFEDPECEALPWDPTWTKKLLHDIPKQLNWNAMRICVGIAPQSWYDIADESGLLLQNEWLYWQNHGWDEQIRKEYTDWVWADGNHPSIAIWDAINENWDAYIGNRLIPELKQLDPTRIWDAGYMTSEHMTLDEMDEPHPYQVYGMRKDFETYFSRHPFPLGDLEHRSERFDRYRASSAAQLVNEYGWIWLWRNGHPAKLTENNYAYYAGKNATPEQCRQLQAYWLQLTTEWLRAERSFAGVLSFCYLTNNYGFTGDWFIDRIKDLVPGPALEWQQHCFAPAAVFIDLVDERYTKHTTPHSPGSWLLFDLVGVNDYPQSVSGEIVVKILDGEGHEAAQRATAITIPPYGKQTTPLALQLPGTSGGYLLLAEFTPHIQQTPSPVISRRYLKVGELDGYTFYEFKPEALSK